MTETTLQKLEKQVVGFPDRARLIVVHDDKSLVVADDFLIVVKKMRKEIKDTFDPIIQKAHQTHKEAVAQKKKYEEPLIRAEEAVKIQVAGYMAEQERIRQEAEEKAFREEEERLRVEREKLKEAEALAREGHEEAAEKVLEEVPLPEVFVPVKGPKLEGVSIRKVWKWEVANIKHVPREYLVVDAARITQLVKSTKGQVRIPGIKIFSERNVAVGSRE